MATTGELRAIIQELKLVDIGDAASYLGEEVVGVEESATTPQPTFALIQFPDHLALCDGFSCQAS